MQKEIKKRLVKRFLTLESERQFELGNQSPLPKYLLVDRKRKRAFNW